MTVDQKVLQPSLPLYYQSWWLDVNRDIKWRYLNGFDNELSMLWPVVERSLWGIKLVEMAPLCQYLGPIFFDSDGQIDLKKDERKTKLVQDALEDYGRINLLKCNLFPESPVVDTFRSSSYVISERRTSRIDTSKSLDVLRKDVSRTRLRRIKGGEKRYVVEDTDVLEEFLRVVKLTYSRKSMDYPLDDSSTARRVREAIERKQGKLLVARAIDTGATAAVAFFAWDNYQLYYLLGGYTETDTKSEAMSLILWNGIMLAKEMGLVFDFEGSMDEKVAYFFQSFGSYVQPYYSVTRVSPPILRMFQKR